MDRSHSIEKSAGKGSVVKLAPFAASRDTTEALRYLLREAEAGRITGLAFVAIQHGPDYSTGVIGRAREVPTLTRGMVRVLEDEVAAI